MLDELALMVIGDPKHEVSLFPPGLSLDRGRLNDSNFREHDRCLAIRRKALGHDDARHESDEERALPKVDFS